MIFVNLYFLTLLLRYTRGMAKRYGQACPVARALELIGERWTLLITRDLLQGARRFQDFQGSLKGIAPNILSERLKLMEEHGLIARRFYSDHPPRAEYFLTEKGQELGHVVGALAVWGSRHLYPEARLVHEGCGEPVASTYYCPKCDERVRGRAVKLAHPRQGHELTAGPASSRPRVTSAAREPAVGLAPSRPRALRSSRERTARPAPLRPRVPPGSREVTVGPTASRPRVTSTDRELTVEPAPSRPRLPRPSRRRSRD